MKKFAFRPLAVAFAGCALSLPGCTSDTAPAPAAAPATPPGATNEPAAAPMKGMVAMSGCPDKDASHVVTAETPVFAGPPGQGAVPIGVLKPGTKVLSMVPGSKYTRCTIADGKSVYVPTDMLKPTTN